MTIILTFLPIAGLILGGVSAIWGLTHELTTKDEKNRRHLTSAGRYSIAFTLLGLFISLNTGVLKAISDNQKTNEAKQAAARKEQSDALKELTRQQQFEATEQKRVREAFADQQRDFELSQQQTREFNEVERLARNRTLDELQRSNRILWDVRRAQYPIRTDQVQITASLEISAQHPDLKTFSDRIALEASSSGTFYWHSISTSDSIPPDTPEMLRNPQIQVLFWKMGSDLSRSRLPDLNFLYHLYREHRGTVRPSNIAYSLDSRTYTVDGFGQRAEKIYSSSKLLSVLDLHGATVEIMCAHLKDGCSSISLKSLTIEFGPNVELVLPAKGFKRTTIFGRNSLVYRLDSDEKSLLEKYVPR